MAARLKLTGAWEQLSIHQSRVREPLQNLHLSVNRSCKPTVVVVVEGDKLTGTSFNTCVTRTCGPAVFIQSDVPNSSQRLTNALCSIHRSIINDYNLYVRSSRLRTSHRTGDKVRSRMRGYNHR